MAAIPVAVADLQPAVNPPPRIHIVATEAARLFCKCGRSILRPPEATSSTRYTCSDCVMNDLRKQNDEAFQWLRPRLLELSLEDGGPVVHDELRLGQKPQSTEATRRKSEKMRARWRNKRFRSKMIAAQDGHSDRGKGRPVSRSTSSLPFPRSS